MHVNDNSITININNIIIKSQISPIKRIDKHKFSPLISYNDHKIKDKNRQTQL